MALRRLARRALRPAPAPPPPQPRAPISPVSRGYLILLRFCASSSAPAPPHFMLDYLVSTCGLPPARAAAAAPRFAHLSSTARPDAVLAFLRSMGLTRAQVRAVVAWCPPLLLSDVDGTLAPKFRAVRALGLTRADAARLFELYPPALTWGVHTNLLPRLLFWLDLLGSARLLMKWLARTWLLRYTVDALLRNLATLRGRGVPEPQLLAAVRMRPSLIAQPPGRVQAVAARADAWGVPRGSGMYVWAFFSLNNVSERAFRAKMAAVMRCTGCTEQEFLAMFHRAPCFVFMSAETLRRKVEFLTGTVGCAAAGILRRPVLLTLSLSKRMEPRCRAVEILKAKGVDVGGESLLNVVRMTEARFVERYILRYSEVAPELLELYPPNRRKGSSRSQGD
ncbi:hypothetical protein ACP4OV_026175 [Aristida adscensionis]